MKNQSFTLHLRNDQEQYDTIEEKLIDKVSEDGPDFLFGMTSGKLYVSFDREAETLNAAIGSASLEVLGAGGIIDRVETHEEEDEDPDVKRVTANYGQMVAMRGPEVCAREINRLQHKIVTAQRMVDPASKVSAILFLEEKNWGERSFSDWQQGWTDFIKEVAS